MPKRKLIVLCVALLIPVAHAAATLPAGVQQNRVASGAVAQTSATTNAQPDTGGLTAIAATLNQRMATRTGPSTAYTEDHGTMPADTPIVVYQQEMGSGVPWVMVEFERSGVPVRAYTGLKRVDVYGDVPWAPQKPALATVSQDTAAHFGPGTRYMPAKSSVARGTYVEVYGEENGWALVDYQYTQDQRIRVWVSVDALQYR